MRVELKIILVLVLIVVAAAWAVLPIQFQVLTPRLGIPAVGMVGEKVNINIRYSLPFVSTRWQGWLIRHDNKTAIQIEPRSGKKSPTDFLDHHFAFNLPASLDVGAYDLLVKNDYAEIRRPKAVHVVKDFPQQISIVQLADLPELGVHDDGDQRLQSIIDEINLINPDFVLLTGDVAYGGTWGQYQRLMTAMEKFDVPVIAAPGNHEYEGWAGYLSLLGQPYHTVDYGPYRIVSLNSGHGRDQLTETQYQWLQNKFKQLNGKIPLVQIHHPLFHRPELRGYVGNHVADMAALFKRHEVPIVLSGHWHGDAVYDDTGKDRQDTWQFPGIPYVVTTTAGRDLRKAYSSSPLHYGYRLIRLNGSKVLNYTYDMDGDGVRDATTSIPVDHLNIQQQFENEDGSPIINVENKLNESFIEAKVSFVLSGETENLVPNVGNIVSLYQSNNNTVVEVQFDLPALSTQSISLKQAVGIE